MCSHFYTLLYLLTSIFDYPTLLLKLNQSCQSANLQNWMFARIRQQTNYWENYGVMGYFFKFNEYRRLRHDDVAVNDNLSWLCIWLSDIQAVESKGIIFFTNKERSGYLATGIFQSFFSSISVLLWLYYYIFPRISWSDINKGNFDFLCDLLLIR